MEKYVINGITILLVTMVLSGCSSGIRNRDIVVQATNQMNGNNSSDIVQPPMDNSLSETENFLLKTTEDLEKYQEDTNTEKNIVAAETQKISDKKIQYINFDTEYQLDLNGDGIDDYFIVSTKVISPIGRRDTPGIVINDISKEVIGIDSPLDSCIIYMYGENGGYRLLVCGGIGNDYEAVDIYDLCNTGAKEYGRINGSIEEIDNENGRILIEDKKLLLGFQYMSAYFQIDENGDLVRDGNYSISHFSGSENTLIEDIRVFLYNNMGQSIETILTPGEKIMSYETDMENKIYFLLEDGRKGVININLDKETGEFYVGDKKLVEYFDEHEMSWAG